MSQERKSSGNFQKADIDNFHNHNFRITKPSYLLPNEFVTLKNHTVLFQNFDAFVVNEADYNKLNSLGYIHPTELGKLKVEHVFQSISFKNKCVWTAINMDGSVFRHCC